MTTCVTFEQFQFQNSKLKVKIKPKNKLDVGSSISMEWLFVQHVLVKLEFRVLILWKEQKWKTWRDYFGARTGNHKNSNHKWPQVSGSSWGHRWGGGGRGELIHSLPCYPYSLTASCVRWMNASCLWLMAAPEQKSGESRHLFSHHPLNHTSGGLYFLSDTKSVTLGEGEEGGVWVG